MRRCDLGGNKTDIIHLVCFTGESVENEELDELLAGLDGYQEAEAAICPDCFKKWRKFISYNKQVNVSCNKTNTEKDP